MGRGCHGLPYSKPWIVGSICAVLLDSMHNVLVLLADERRFELPAGFSVRLRQMLAKEFEKAKH